MNKEIIKALGDSKNFDIDANNDYVAEMLEGQLDSFIKNKKIKLSDDDFEKWVKEIQVLCAECYKCGWERALKDAEEAGTLIRLPCKVSEIVKELLTKIRSEFKKSGILLDFSSIAKQYGVEVEDD